MLKKAVVCTIVLVMLASFAVIVQVVTRRTWERRVWSCYAALESGAPLKSRFLIPEVCAPNKTLVGDLGTAKAHVLLGFRPPRTMWLAYVSGTVDYDSYVIELRNHEGVTRARVHHGSD
jgi:hypothetical protein